MPLISIPTKALEGYVKRCHMAWNASDQQLFETKCNEAHAYQECIKDICGLDVWGHIVMEADMSFPEGVPCCCGIPFNRKNDEDIKP
jgi:hypothetical protein